MNYIDIDERFKNKKLAPDDFYAVIEISKGSKNKYEYDHDTGLLNLDRILYTSTHYPENYGFIPNTLAEDGDPLDVLVMCSETIVPLATVRCKAIGVVKMIDGGSRDYKIIAVPLNDTFYNCYNDVSDLPIHLLEEIKHFFMVYKTLEGKVTNIKDVMGKDEARDVMNNCIKAKNEEKK